MSHTAASNSPSTFPTTITFGPNDDWQPCVADSRTEWLEQLQVSGALLFRNLRLPDVETFDRFVTSFELPNFRYADSLSNAVRVNHTDRVFTANEAPASVNIYLHHEMAQTPVFPSKLFFYCQTAPGEGGATPLCRSDLLLQRLRQECPVASRTCEQEGLRYTNVMPGNNDSESGMGRSWQSTLSVDSTANAEERLADLGYTWKWLDNDCLQATTPVLPAVRKAPGGQEVFFNQLIAATQGWKDARNDPRRAITLGNGAPLPQDLIDTASDLSEELTYDVAWEAGDVALVDNFLVMHGRRPYNGTRKVFASLVAHAPENIPHAH